MFDRIKCLSGVKLLLIMLIVMLLICLAFFIACLMEGLYLNAGIGILMSVGFAYVIKGLMEDVYNDFVQDT